MTVAPAVTEADPAGDASVPDVSVHEIAQVRLTGPSSVEEVALTSIHAFSGDVSVTVAGVVDPV
ncbi:MAG TPA: hypothetical protein VN969_47325 [Streptosporangiaceae bacterium]|nr:hypothetical protein [Streptosporangiaceae bacterium]